MLTERATYDPSRTFEVKTFDVDYCRAGDEVWLARIYQPQGTGPFPALLDIHGGAWSANDRTADARMNQALAASGLLVAAVDFRLGPRDPYPASLIDTNLATRWLKAHAADLNGQAGRIGAMGSSSGGHMIILSAMRPRHPAYTTRPLPEAPDLDASLDYVIGCWPVIDPFARYHFAQATGRQDLVTRHEGYFLTLDAMREGNPQQILDRGEPADLPPTLIIIGTNDNNVPLSIPERFVESYRAAGGTIEMSVFPGLPHGFGNQPGPDSARAIGVMQDFIARQLAR